MERREHTYGYEDATGVTPPPWTGPAVGLMDLDAFFASVEMLDHPEWRGKPLIVGGDADSRGVVSTCSYEANFLSDGNLSNAAKSMQALKSLISRGV